MEITGRTKVFGIFGYPVTHSLSPALHNAVFQKRKLDAVYLPFEVKPDYLVEAVEALKSLNIQGVNVTVPHKEQAANFVDEIPHDVDRAIGAVNTIVFRDGKLLGYNTDGPGFLEDLREAFDFDPKGKTVLVIGAGGTARAIAFSLLKTQCGRLVIYNRTPERAEGLAAYLTKFFPKGDVKSILSIEDLSGAVDLVVNASSCGMKPEDPFPVNPEILKNARLFYDVIYAPAETKFLREAKKLGIRAANGAGMLLRQAAFAQSVWFPSSDKRETYAIMKEAFQSCRPSS